VNGNEPFKWPFDPRSMVVRPGVDLAPLAADVAMSSDIQCAQVLGGYGFTFEMPAEKLLRDATIERSPEGRRVGGDFSSRCSDRFM
jgi:hypothetical protein